MSLPAKRLPSPLAEDGERRHGVISTPLEADVFRNIPYNTHATQAIQSPFGTGPVPGPATDVFFLSVLWPESIISRPLPAGFSKQFRVPTDLPARSERAG